jgi:hypothetical protein
MSIFHKPVAVRYIYWTPTSRTTGFDFDSFMYMIGGVIYTDFSNEFEAALVWESLAND